MIFTNGETPRNSSASTTRQLADRGKGRGKANFDGEGPVCALHSVKATVAVDDGTRIVATRAVGSVGHEIDSQGR
ncbi:hypothetical protein [Corynebacterium sp. 20_84]